MIVTTHGRAFEISGKPFGTMAAWRLVKEGGKPLTAEQFEALPPDAQEWIVDAVKLHVERANENQAPTGEQ